MESSDVKIEAGPQKTIRIDSTDELAPKKDPKQILKNRKTIKEHLQNLADPGKGVKYYFESWSDEVMVV